MSARHIHSCTFGTLGSPLALDPMSQVSSIDVDSAPPRETLPRPWKSSETAESVDDEFVAQHQLASRKSTGSSTTTQPSSDDDDMDDSSSVDLLMDTGRSSRGAVAVAPTLSSTSPPLPPKTVGFKYDNKSLESTESTGSTTTSEPAGVGAGPDSDSSTASDDSFSLLPSRKRR